jgi:hypothetical protein
LKRACPSSRRSSRPCLVTPDVLASFLERFKSTALTEEEVVALVAPPKLEPKTSKRFSERVIVARYGLKRWLRSQNLVFRIGYVIGWCYLIISSVAISFTVKHVWTVFALVSAVAVISGKIRFMIRDMKPKNMQIIDRGYNERKVQLQRLIEISQRWHETRATSVEIQRYRSDALGLVADYVRDHRARFREILANLLVPDTGDFVVIGRSDGIRPVPQKYSREQCALVAQAIETGEAKITGDLYTNFPNTVPVKKYNSVLVLPVWFQGSVVGAVSIDSQEKYHFHMDFEDLQVHLLPYVQLLAAGLPRAHDVSEPPVYG